MYIIYLIFVPDIEIIIATVKMIIRLVPKSGCLIIIRVGINVTRIGSKITEKLF
jgi:hypothetical protein